MEANTQVATAANELCQVVALPSTTHALRGVVNTIHVLFNVITGHVVESEAKRSPINLCIVLDRSGSMDSGHKLSNAKLAIKKVIEALGADDILHLVLYGSQVETVFANANVSEREKLLAQVDRVSTEGMTNLHAGLKRGAEEVSKYTKPGYTNRIFLFSDGLVNEGVTDKQKIYSFISQDIYTEKDTKVSAFGLGKDFDENLMKNIAEHGCGAYFFIEGSAAIPSFVAFALKGLFKLVGTDSAIKMRGLNGAVVTKIFSHADPVKPYKFDDLKQDDRRSVVCELQITPTAQPSEEVLQWELEYRPSANADEALNAPKVVIKGSVRMYFTDNESDVSKGENAHVLAKVAIQRTGELDAEIIALINSGKAKEAIAVTEKELEILRSVLDKDVDGSANIAGHLKQVEAALADLHREGASKSNMKKAHHRNYMKRRASICYEEQYLDEALNEQVQDVTQAVKNVNLSASDSDSDNSPVTSPRIRRNLRYS